MKSHTPHYLQVALLLVLVPGLRIFVYGVLAAILQKFFEVRSVEVLVSVVLLALTIVSGMYGPGILYNWELAACCTNFIEIRSVEVSGGL